jgi:tRNA C32,U32 (ribose-2'-O)-methylase TrmJ
VARNTIVADDGKNFVLKRNRITYRTRWTHYNRSRDFILFTGKETEGTQNERVFFHMATLRIFSNGHVFSMLNFASAAVSLLRYFTPHFAPLDFYDEIK